MKPTASDRTLPLFPGEPVPVRKSVIPAKELRRLAVEHDVDERSIVKAWRGESVRGAAGERASRAVEA